MAHISLRADLINEATVYGTNGSIRIAAPFWCSTSFELRMSNSEPQTFHFPLPDVKPGHTFNFSNSVGLHFQAIYLQNCLATGKLESELLSLDESLTIMRTLDNIRRQLGVVYPQEHR